MPKISAGSRCAPTVILSRPSLLRLTERHLVQQVLALPFLPASPQPLGDEVELCFAWLGGRSVPLCDHEEIRFDSRRRFELATLDNILVQDRNNAAMKILNEEIKRGTKKIAVFYGAGHLPGFDRRLTKDLKLKRESVTWDRAWDLTGN